MKLSEAIMDLYKNGSSFLRCEYDELKAFSGYAENQVGVFYVFRNGAYSEYSFYLGQTFRQALYDENNSDKDVVCHAMKQDIYQDGPYTLHFQHNYTNLIYKTGSGDSVNPNDEILNNEVYYTYDQEL